MPASMETHEAQVRQGSPSTGCSQLRALARMRGARRLAGAPRPAEEVGVADAAVADGVVQRRHDVLLAAHLAEPPGPVPPVEGLVGHEADATARHFTGEPPCRYPDHSPRLRMWRPGPVQLQAVNQVRAGRQQPSADPAVCRRSPGRHLRGRGGEVTWRGARAAESARLESVCGATHRGFESHPLRQDGQVRTPVIVEARACASSVRRRTQQGRRSRLGVRASLSLTGRVVQVNLAACRTQLKRGRHRPWDPPNAESVFEVEL